MRFYIKIFIKSQNNFQNMGISDLVIDSENTCSKCTIQIMFTKGDCKECKKCIQKNIVTCVDCHVVCVEDECKRYFLIFLISFFKDYF